MRRLYVPLVAITGFLMVWLGMSPQVEGEFDPGIDRVLVSQAQSEKAAEPAADAAVTAAADSTDAAKKDEAAPTAAAVPATAPVTPIAVRGSCLPAQALADLNQSRKSIEERESALQAREAELAAREKALEERMKQLEAFRGEATKLDAALAKESEEKAARTVELLESMSPKAASALLATSDDRLAVRAMSRMSTQKLSKIMNLIEPKRSVRLMELLAGTGTPAVEAEKQVPSTAPAKEEKL